MDDIAVKTRYGLILQSLVVEAFDRAKVTYRENWKYNPNYERPDFTIPDSDNPHYIVEVHKTDVRESFRMKVLRLFSAVMEAKTYFGKTVVSINLFFGDPKTELPNNNLETLFSFFDVNLIPQQDKKYGGYIKTLEDIALVYAADDKVDVASAKEKIVKEQSESIDMLSSCLSESLQGANIKKSLVPLWEAEAERISTLNNPPLAGTETFYKGAILKSLFLSEEHFNELIKKQDPNLCSLELKEQLIKIGLVNVRPSVSKNKGKADILSLQPIMEAFVRDPYSKHLRELCNKQMENNLNLYWFLEDIRNSNRRELMVATVIELAKKGHKDLLAAFKECMNCGIYNRIDHTRCWIADILPLIVGESHNSFNRRMRQSKNYKQTLANPYSNIVIRSPRLGKSVDECACVSIECFFKALNEHEIDLNKIDFKELSSKILKFRLDAIIKLQKFNPLHFAIESVSTALGLTVSYKGVKTFLSDIRVKNDLTEKNDMTGKNDLFTISDGVKEVLVNAVYIGGKYGSDHKADEWSARCRSLSYRIKKGNIVPVPRAGYIFVIDGIWSNKSVRKLYSAGWNYVCRLSELERILKKIFDK